MPLCDEEWLRVPKDVQLLVCSFWSMLLLLKYYIVLDFETDLRWLPNKQYYGNTQLKFQQAPLEQKERKSRTPIFSIWLILLAPLQRMLPQPEPTIDKRFEYYQEQEMSSALSPRKSVHFKQDTVRQTSSPEIIRFEPTSPPRIVLQPMAGSGATNENLQSINLEEPVNREKFTFSGHTRNNKGVAGSITTSFTCVQASSRAMNRYEGAVKQGEYISDGGSIASIPNEWKAHTDILKESAILSATRITSNMCSINDLKAKLNTLHLRSGSLANISNRGNYKENLIVKETQKQTISKDRIGIKHQRHQSQISLIGAELERLQKGLQEIDIERKQLKPVFTTIIKQNQLQTRKITQSIPQKSYIPLKSQRQVNAPSSKLLQPVRLNSPIKQQEGNQERNCIYEKIDSIMDETKTQISDKVQFRSLLQQEYQHLEMIKTQLEKENEAINRKNAQLESEELILSDDEVKFAQELATLKSLAHSFKLQIQNFSIQHQGQYQQLTVERDVVAERLQVNQQLAMMENMRNQLSLSEQDLQIQELQCRIHQKQDEIEKIQAQEEKSHKAEKQCVQMLSAKTQGLADKINLGLIKKNGKKGEFRNYQV